MNSHGAVAQTVDLDSPLLFPEVVSYSLEHSPSITSAKSNISTAEAQKLAAIASFLPSVSVTDEVQMFRPVGGASNSVLGGIVVPTKSGFDANIASANLSYNLFNGGQDIANYKASIAALRSANLGETATLDAMLKQILEAYTSVCIDQITVRSQSHIVNIDQELVDLTKMRMQRQMSSEIDVIQVQQELFQAETELSQARQRMTSDLESLFSDMGFARGAGEDSVQEWIPKAPEVPTGKVRIEKDPAIQSAQETVLAAQEKVTAARGGYYPSVALIGQYNYIGLNGSSLGDAWHSTRPNNYTVGLVVSIPLLPHYDTSAKVDTALAALENAKGNYRAVRAKVASQVFSAARNMREAADVLKIAINSARLAHKNIKLMQYRFEGRQSDKRDVDNATSAAAQADRSLSVARLNMELATWEQYAITNPTQFPDKLLESLAAGYNVGASDSGQGVQ